MGDRAVTGMAAVSVAASLALAAGCRTADDVMRDYRANIVCGGYAAAAAEPSELAAKGGGDALLWRLMSARARDLAGDTDLAIADYDKAEDVMIENGRSPVFSRAVDAADAMMLNDRFFPYDGGGQDRIFTCMYKAVCYASKGDTAAARSELNRAAQHQENWLYERRADLSAAEARLGRESARYSKEKGGRDSSGQSRFAVQNAFRDGPFRATVRENYGVDIFSSGVLDDLRPEDYQNPYMSHLCGVFRWLWGDGGAREHLRDAARLRPRNSVAAADLARCSGGERPTDQVWVYVEDGLSPAREAWRIDLPVLLIPYAARYVKYAGLCLPRLMEMPAAASSWRAMGAEMEELASVEALVKVEYDVYMRGAIRREVTRTVVDVGVQAALGIAAEHAGDRNTKLALAASQFAAAAYSALRRGADVRSWPSLPKRVLVARVARPADGRVSVSADGMPVAEVTVPEGNSAVFVRKPSRTSAASVRAVNF